MINSSATSCIMLYRTSNQRKKYLHSIDKLSAIRKENRERSVHIIKETRNESRNEPDQEQAWGDPESKKSGKIKAISVEDELKLLKYYASKIQGICQALHFPAKVRATALLYLKRAYLTFSALDHNPKDIMLACIYLAGKVEENYIGAEEFCRVAKQDEAVVLRGETILLEALDFDLIVYTPYRPLQGFLLELAKLQPELQQSSSEGKLEDGKQLSQIRAKSLAAIDALMLTDAPLIFPPGQLALAALRSGMKTSGLPIAPLLSQVVERSLAAAQGCGVTISGNAEARLSEDLQKVDSFGVDGATPINEQEVRKVDRKLTQCHNLLLDPTSSQFQKAAAEQQEREAKAKAEKAAARRKRNALHEAKLLDMVPGRGPTSLDARENGGIAIVVPANEEHPAKRRRSEL